MAVTTGGEPKLLGDDQVLLIRPDFGRMGSADIWAIGDVTVAFMSELDRIFAAITASGSYADFKTAMTVGGSIRREHIRLVDWKDGSE